MSSGERNALKRLKYLLHRCYGKYHCAPVAVVCPFEDYQEIKRDIGAAQRSGEVDLTVDFPNPEVYGMTLYPSHFAPSMLPLFGSLYGALAFEHEPLDAAQKEEP